MLVAALAAGAFNGLLPGGPTVCRVGGAVNECGSARGVVLDVRGSGPAEVNAFTLRTAEGEVLDFVVERLELDAGGKPAPHLREHRLDGLPIEVEYKVEDGRRVALRYRDAD